MISSHQSRVTNSGQKSISLSLPLRAHRGSERARRSRGSGRGREPIPNRRRGVFARHRLPCLSSGVDRAAEDRLTRGDGDSASERVVSRWGRRGGCTHNALPSRTDEVCTEPWWWTRSHRANGGSSDVRSKVIWSVPCMQNKSDGGSLNQARPTLTRRALD